MQVNLEFQIQTLASPPSLGTPLQEWDGLYLRVFARRALIKHPPCPAFLLRRKNSPM